MNLLINLSTEEFFYRGLYIHFSKVKPLIPQNFLKQYQLGRPVLLPEARLMYRYAWDAVFTDMKASGELHKLLDTILSEEEE
jgi:hypothetical protein